MIEYYEVYVGSINYKGDKPLIYSYDSNIKVGQVVIITLRNNACVGLVVKKVNEYKNIKSIKKIDSVLPIPKLNSNIIELIDWFRLYYSLGIGAATTQFIPNYLQNTNRKVVDKISITSTNLKINDSLKLNTQQLEVVRKISNSKIRHNLLMGETASGKTHVYIELIKNTIKNKKSCMLLTPEIGLTPQLISSVQNYIKAPIYVIHSRLTMVQRRTLWLLILIDLRPKVIIGPRSALFTPVNNLGLIILDEQHDSAYHQSQEPRYSADHVAAKLANLNQAKLIFGTATPKVQDYYIFEKKELPIYKLPSLFSKKIHKKDITIIDQRDHTKFTKTANISDKILNAISENKHLNRQTLLFLNRRGTSRLIACNNCGWQKHCKRCNVSMTFHKDEFLTRCHNCGWSDKPPLYCPDCKNKDLIFKGIGTKGLVEELLINIPGLVITRLDTDVKKNNRLENIYERLKTGKTDVLIGTQMISKGLDLPHLKTVAVISADSSLYMPDYTAEEQTFQIINQVIGRVGRGHGDAEIFIQTYQPNSKVLEFATQNNYQKFYKWQLYEREKYNYPPFVFMMVLTTEAKFQNTAKAKMMNLYQQLLKYNTEKKFFVSEPAPKFIELMAGKYRWQIVIKSKNRSKLVEIKNKFGQNFRVDFDPINLL